MSCIESPAENWYNNWYIKGVLLNPRTPVWSSEDEIAWEETETSKWEKPSDAICLTGIYIWKSSEYVILRMNLVLGD